MSLASTVFGFLHNGGIAGRDESPVRYHNGGISGLRPDEVPAILQRGEEVLTAADPRHRNNKNGDTGGTNIRTGDIIIQGNADQDTVRAIGRQQSKDATMWNRAASRNQ